MQSETHYPQNGNVTMGTTTITEPYSSEGHLPNYAAFGYSRLVGMKHQDMMNRHALCLTRLRQVAREVDLLRLENAALRSFNVDLKSKLALSLQTRHPFSSHYCNHSGGRGEVGVEEEESPTSVMEVKNVEETVAAGERVSMPKSISVRSNGYLKLNNTSSSSSSITTTQGEASKTRSVTRSRTPPMSSFIGSRRVYVRGGEQNEKEPLELDVYNQGMIKTELCNKWQEVGACPYGDRCQFAHGIEELRPVLRHPRYKTEACRMVLAGDICPYGHRCHFRHVLTEEERFVLGPTTL